MDDLTPLASGAKATAAIIAPTASQVGLNALSP